MMNVASIGVRIIVHHLFVRFVIAFFNTPEFVVFGVRILEMDHEIVRVFSLDVGVV